mmetsp:Transcript_16078/g.30136  ORF Transcript_16078/g.30136 Transcript_16078/m.30136 type:complete len:307 (-) Transcript_16078:56-976(-)|eukprot:CAMPEP_0182504996 /NCGR_PEP_ID=MMETSP1321-20130603/18253_1 /TAXON_ID=91990 /ORGANISM="Bolidomonas sp., Strain RCC1657" /LENGTH=306 /DNA_ID=CAMNT_0024710453 /DNA_START=38 /DNA_END=958 /DNA_ORIENTATION=+
MASPLSSSLNPLDLQTLITTYLHEDCPGPFDLGGYVVGPSPKTAHLYLKSPGYLCGIPFVNAVFSHLSCTITWFTSSNLPPSTPEYTCLPAVEGEYYDPSPTGKILLATITGPASNLLLGERTALNILSRASGVTTEANRYAKRAKELGWSGSISGTRKTTPGFRLIEKYALLLSHCDPHRLSLSHMIMLKDNHINSRGSISEAVKAAKIAGFTTKIEVECSDYPSALSALRSGASIIMLDNYKEGCERDAKKLKEEDGRVIVEASGGVEYETLERFCTESVDIVSVGKLTQGYPCLDFSMKLQKE